MIHNNDRQNKGKYTVDDCLQKRDLSVCLPLVADTDFYHF